MIAALLLGATDAAIAALALVAPLVEGRLASTRNINTIREMSKDD